MDKHKIAKVFEEIALLMELTGENPFKIQAYRSAARQLENLTEDLAQLIKEEKLSQLAGIGKALSEKITTLFTTGHLPLLEQLKKEIPKGLLEMLNIPGLGAKKIKTIYRKLGIKTLASLKEACQQGKLSKLSGFGTTTENNILTGILHLEEYNQRHLWWHAIEVATPILEGLQKLREVEQVEIAGSVRRKLETVGDLDFLVSSANPQPIMDWFTSQDWVAKIIAKGNTKSSIRLKSGMQADLRVVPKPQFPFALHYFTGSKEHNIKIRQRAHEYGLSLNEYGFTPLKNQTESPICLKKIQSEKEIYETLNLPYIHPEIREDLGEIEAAEQGNLPDLITYKDIRGAFHNHTTDSDGHHTLEEMASAAEQLGWEYLGVSDHSKSSVQANGMSEERLAQQIEKIRKLNQSKRFKTYLFTGVECDILNKGELDLSDNILKELDYVVVSIHSGFKQDEKTITKRLIRAIEHPLSTMVGHFTGRLLLKREAYAVNVNAIIDAAIANNTIIEINANPRRLDMDWRLWHQAKEKGLQCAINPDAHTINGLRHYQAGVNIARKGWLEKKDVINTYPLAEIKDFLAG